MDPAVKSQFSFMNKIAVSAGTGFKDEGDLGQKVLLCNLHLNSCYSERKMGMGFAYQRISPLHPEDRCAWL